MKRRLDLQLKIHEEILTQSESKYLENAKVTEVVKVVKQPIYNSSTSSINILTFSEPTVISIISTLFLIIDIFS